MAAKYDRIGVGYADIRRPDPRLAALIDHWLGDARTVLNVGAGAGSYEPVGRTVVAVEPSRLMLDQHPGPLRVQGVAGALPCADSHVDAAMAVMTIHHWPDPLVGLRELRRAASRQLVFTWDPDFRPELWLVAEYLPEIGELERSRFPSLADTVDALDAHTVVPFEIPWDFADGYQPAFWRRPEHYLDPVVRAASSTFAVLPDSIVEPAVARLRADLDSGAWQDRHADLLERQSMDYGYRLVVAGD